MRNYINIKRILLRVKTLIINPSKEWNKIKAEEHTTKELFYNFVFPFLALCSLLIFVGGFLAGGLLIGIKSLFGSFIAMTLSMYTGSKILKEITNSYENTTEKDCFKMIIYSSSVFCLFHSLSGLLSVLSILSNLFGLTQFIAVWTIWNGIKPIMKTNKSNLTGFTFVIALLTLLLPLVLEKLLAVVLGIPIAEF